MNLQPDNRELLDDVLSETSGNFRDALLGQTLRLVRRRRRWQQTRRAAGVLAVLGLLGIFLLEKNPPQPPVIPPIANAVKKNYKLVQTQPLPSNAIIATQRLAAGRLVESRVAAEIVATGAGRYKVINDDELLTLLGSHPALLVRTGPDSERLIFANPEDEKGFPLN